MIELNHIEEVLWRLIKGLRSFVAGQRVSALQKPMSNWTVLPGELCLNSGQKIKFRLRTKQWGKTHPNVKQFFQQTLSLSLNETKALHNKIAYYKERFIAGNFNTEAEINHHLQNFFSTQHFGIYDYDFPNGAS